MIRALRGYFHWTWVAALCLATAVAASLDYVGGWAPVVIGFTVGVAYTLGENRG